VKDTNILDDNIGSIELLWVAGSDCEVVNDARESTGKRITEMQESDKKFLVWLLSQNPPHSSPLRGSILKFHVKCPLFVARQWWKHVVGSTVLEGQSGWNEYSLRYSEPKLEFYLLPQYHSQDTKNRQLSGDKLDDAAQWESARMDEAFSYLSALVYKRKRELGVSKEESRQTLPVNLYTSFVWTCSLEAAIHFVKLRDEHTAQKEISLYASFVKRVIIEMFPVVSSVVFKGSL
jgi:thymidylate synthase (FAD)